VEEVTTLMLEFHKLEARKTATERKDFDTTIYHTRGLFGKTLQNGIRSEARAGEEEKKLDSARF